MFFVNQHGPRDVRCKEIYIKNHMKIFAIINACFAAAKK